jgi:ABC-type oligopeptide transport system substrate-binding subunit
MAVLRDAEKLLLDEAPILPIKQYARAYLLNPAVKGFKPHTLNQHPALYVFKE